MRKGGVLCPIEGLEVLLVRRDFWNPITDAPMSFPGEWTFPGGHYEKQDNSLLETALREFREELDYKGKIEDTKFLRSATTKYYVEYYSAKINPQEQLTPQPGELIDYRWITPQAAIDLILSDNFNNQQLEDFKQYNIPHRQYPMQTIATLELIKSLKKS